MKRIVALFSVVLIALFALPALAHAEETTTLTITADKTVANPGDRVNFSLMLGAVNNLGGMNFYIDLPEGLSIDYSSVAVPEGVMDILNADGDGNVPTEKNENNFDCSMKEAGYTGTADLCILKFTCTVDSDSALETKSIGLREVDVFGNDLDMTTINTTVQVAKLQIEGTKPPVATPTPTPGTVASPTPTPGAASPTPTPGVVATPTPVPVATATPTPIPTPQPTTPPEVTPRYLEDLDALIEEVETGTTISVSKKDGIFSLNRDILRTLNERGVSLEMEYSYEGKDYKIFIPAGKAVIEDDVFWCGPLYLAGKYGTNSTGIGVPSQDTPGIGQALKQVVKLNP